ncbi:MAG: hypothetical protein ACR2P3_00305 [Geminicoccaceae bacterium]
MPHQENGTSDRLDAEDIWARINRATPGTGQEIYTDAVQYMAQAYGDHINALYREIANLNARISALESRANQQERRG